MYTRDPNSRNQSARPNPPDNYGGTAFRVGEAQNPPAEIQLPPVTPEEDHLDLSGDPIPGHILRNLIKEPVPHSTDMTETRPENILPGTDKDLTPGTILNKKPMTGNNSGNINMTPGQIGTKNGANVYNKFQRPIRGLENGLPVPDMKPPEAEPPRIENIPLPEAQNGAAPEKPKHENEESIPAIPTPKESKNPLKNLFSSIIPPMGKHGDKDEFGFEELLILGLILLLSQSEGEGDNDILLILALLLFFQ
jgi:hypothetical protein